MLPKKLAALASLFAVMLLTAAIDAVTTTSDCYTQAKKNLGGGYYIGCDTSACDDGDCDYDSSETGGIHKHWCECSDGGSSSNCSGYLLSNEADPESLGYDVRCFKNHTCPSEQICDKQQLEYHSFERLCECVDDV